MEYDISELSREEETELHRSKKKVKENSNIGTVGAHGDRSYKDKLLGEIPGAFAQAFKFSDVVEVAEDSDEEIEELSEGMASVRLSKETKLLIRSKWATALIVKVFGKSVGYHYLHSRILNLWKPAGRLECVDLGKEFFLIRFGLVDDFDFVLENGPWFIGEHFLTIRPWEPNFKPSLACCSSVAVWARFPELPIEYYEFSVLKKIGLSIGPVLRIDTHTASEARGRYARICVQVNVDVPLVKSILIGGFVQPVVYEGLNLLCFVCGRLGHRKTNCPYSVRAPVPEPCPDVSSGVNGGKDSALVREEGPQHGPSEEEYGPWVLVTRKRSSPKVGSKRVDGTSFNASRSQDFYPVDNTIKLRSRTHGTVDASIIRGSPDGKRKTRHLSRSSSPRDQRPPDTSSGLGLNKASILSNTPSLAFSFASGENNIASSSDHGKHIPTSRGRRNSSVGNQSKGNTNHRSTCGIRLDQGKSHCDLGMVRSRDKTGLELHLPVNPGEQSQPVSSLNRPGLGRMEQSMVEISNGCSTGGGEQDSLLEDAARNFKGANLVRIGSLRRDFRKKDAGGEADCRELHGKCGPQKIDPGVSAKLSVQDCNLSTGVEDGHFRACGASDTGDEALSDADEGDGMEFIGADEVSAPN